MTYSEFALLTTEDLTTRHHTVHIAGDLFMSKDPAGRYFVALQGDVIDTPLPESLVNRILTRLM